MSHHESLSPVRYMTWILRQIYIFILGSFKSFESEFLVYHRAQLLFLKIDLFLFFCLRCCLFFLFFSFIVIIIRLFCYCLSLIIKWSCLTKRSCFSFQYRLFIISSFKQHDIRFLFVPSNCQRFNIQSLSVFIVKNESVIVDKKQECDSENQISIC